MYYDPERRFFLLVVISGCPHVLDQLNGRYLFKFDPRAWHRPVFSQPGFLAMSHLVRSTCHLVSLATIAVLRLMYDARPGFGAGWLATMRPIKTQKKNVETSETLSQGWDVKRILDPIGVVSEIRWAVIEMKMKMKMKMKVKMKMKMMSVIFYQTHWWWWWYWW